MDSETDTSREDHQKNGNLSQKPSTTAISTIVLNSKPIQLVVAILQSGDTYHIKVVEIDPKLTFLGSNIEEAVLLQKQHDEVFKQLQNKNSPIDEFVPKAERLLQQNQARPEVLDAMGQSLSLAWADVLKLLQQKKHILDLNVNFHEKLGICKGKMSALEVACRDTMIPIEIESVQEFLNKFKQLRIEVLASVMVALKEGNELLANLRELAHTGTVDSRPDHIKYEVKKSIHQVEKWLEELHDRRNILESAWQTRKIQLEQCLALAIFAKELGDVETVLKNRKNELSSMPNLGDSESSAIHLLQDYIALKQDAVSLRDKALKITRATEKLVTTGCFAGDEACSRAYSVLNGCVEYLDSIEQIESLLVQSKEFFAKAEKALSVLEKLEIEVSTSKHADGSSEAINIHAKVLDEIVGLTEEPLRLGYAILAEIGRSNANVSGIERVIEDIENRKIYLEEICTINSEHSLKVSESLNAFLEKHNKILSWLVSIAEASLRNSNSMGTSLPECNDFLKVHHQLLSDLEARGNEINNQLLTVTQILNEIEDDQRKDIDQKVDAIHTHWIELKNIVENRVDLVSILIQFLKLADSLSNMFNYLENVLKSVPEEEKMNQLNNIWSKVQPAYAQLKSEGERFIDETSKVADPYLETKSACRRVEEILNDFRGRQFNITESWESWTTRLVEQRETELLYETIMTENTNKINAATKLDAQLYPVLTTPSDEPATIKQFVSDKLSGVLSEIAKASNEIDNRIHTTSTLQPKDEETRDKVKQVIRNLYGIKDKLSAISSNYRMLLESLISFLGNIVNTQTEIETYFRNKSQQSVNHDGNVDAVLSDHERFKDRIMQQFRELIAESERIIDVVRDQEPDGAKEHDADRIIRLLEQLRVVFEMQSDGRSSELTEKKKQSVIMKFNKELNEIHQNLDDITKQLNDTQGQYGETTASARTIALGFEYFERTIQLMEKRIDNFIHTSESISKTYPDIGRFVDDEVQKLRQRWDDIRTRTQNTRRTIDLANEYFELADGIEQTYRDHNNNLQNITNQIIHIKTYNEAKSLTTTIDNYITNNEAQQLDRLKSLSNLSNKIYGFDKTVPMYTDNISLFQSFFKLKSDLSTLADQFKSEEAARQQNSKDEVDKRVVEVQFNRQEMVPALSETKYEHPVFTQPLCDATIQEGDKIILQCVAKGYPEPSIEWFKDQLSIQHNPDYHRKYENGLCTLSIEETFAEDSARFSCKASNCVGATETTCMLTVKEAQLDEMLVPPNFVKFLENGFAKEGGSFEFRCTVTGNPLPTVQWFKNDVCVDNVKDYCISYNNGEAVLRFEEVFLEDQAVFTCKATNMVGIAQCSAGLSVQSLQPSEMPVFRVPLTNIMARVGQKIKLECEITGTPRPQIFWSHNGKPFSGRDFKSQYDNERATLVIPEAFPKDAGVYIVTAKNLAGEAYSSCNVSVKGRLPNETSDSELASDMEPVKPSVQLPLKDISVFEGKPVRLDCVIVAQPEPEVIWYHNNRPVKESVDVQLVFQGDRCSLIIQEAYLEDGGDYRVVAINSAGEASSSCTLSITPLNELEPATRSQNERILPSEMPPKFERLLSDILADEGEVIEFECSLVGDPKPLIKWYLNNKEIFESDRIQFKQNEDGTVKLIIHNVTNSDKGVYTVKASNSCGDAKCFSHLIVKSVNAPESLNIQIQQPEIESHLVCPTFKELFKDKTVQIDEPAKFECIVVGKPTPKIKWFFNDQPVAGKNFLVSTSGDRQVLTIPKVLSETVGKISCVAENDVGKATCVAYLSLQGDFNAPSSQQSQRYIEEHNTGSSNVTIRKQVFTTTHTSQINTFDNANGIPQTQVHAFSSKLDQSVKKTGDQSPEVLESKQFQEYRQINDLPPQMQQRSIVNFIKPTGSETVPELPKIVRKNMSPRFVSPLVGKIVDQGSDVMLEAIVDGYPVPDLVVTKNGEPLIPSANVSIVHKLNKINIELRHVGVEDAGRYSCTASNPAGSSTSTADVVVKKSIFPPVFGHRLQAQVAKRGERIRMDVEVSGTPSPTVTWFKDNQPLSNKTESYSIKQSGNNHTLIIEAAHVQDAGKYMVRAVNAGGEAQSIADFAVMEPTPERMVEVVKTVVFDNVNDKKNFTTSSLIQKNISMNSKSIKFHEEPRSDPLPFVPEPSRPVMSVKVPPPPSPSKFVKGEFKESDYESDYDRKVPPVWRPSNDSDSEPMYYKPIRPILTPTGRQSKLSDGKSPIPPTEFENPLQFEGPPRPKFEPIDKPKTNFVKAEPTAKPAAQQQLFKPKPVAARPVQQPAYQQQPNQYPKQPCRYYTAVAGPPQHIAAETSNTMHMSESTESSHRVVNMSQTKRIIQFDARKSEFEQKLEPFPYSPDQPSYTQRPNRLPPPPTPTKFVPAEFRESDYESEVEAARIRPVWTPNPSDSDEPQYRRVSAPQQYRSASVPRSYGHSRVLTPMEFDTKPIEMPRKIVIETSGPRTINKTQTLDRYSSKKSHFNQSSTRDDIELKPSSPPKYGFIPGQMVNQAEQHMYDMNSTFKTKAQQFVSDVVRDTQTPNIRPILKKDGNEGDKPQIYREDSRVSQYDITSHIIETSTELKTNIINTSEKWETRMESISFFKSPTSSVTVHGMQSIQHGGSNIVSGALQQGPPPPQLYHQGDISPPVFEQIFKNARFAQGGNATFDGRLRGNPKPVVSWTRKGAPLLESSKFRMSYNENTGDVSLLINQIGPGDEGEYTCTARNQFGEAICSVYIQPEGQPMPPMQNYHQQYEQSYQSQQGSNVGQSFQRYEQKSSQYSNGYNNYSLIEEEFKVDTFEYRLLREVSFRESITRRSSHEVDSQLTYEVDRNLGPAAPPQIQQKPRNSKLVEGADAVFSAKVASNPKPRLTWFRNGQRLAPSTKYETTYSNNQASLRVKNSNSADSGHYTLLAENTQGCVVSSAVLVIEPAQETPSYEPRPHVDAMAEAAEAGKALPPNFIRGFQDRETTEGKMTRFDCRLTGRPYPEVFWFINDKQVFDDATHKILVNEQGNHSLMITNVSRYDGGVVSCIARNKAGEVTTQARLTVLEKEQVVAPKFVERFTTVNVREGEPVTLNARAVGTPAPRITWQKDGVAIGSSPNVHIAVDGGFTTLDIPRAHASDAGWYQCTAQNVAGSTATRARLFVETPKGPAPEQRRLYFPRPTKVIEPQPEPEPEVIYLKHVERTRPHPRPGEEDRVYPPPQFIIPLRDVTQIEGGKIHFEGRIEPVGDPSMYVEWFLNGRALTASSRSTYTFKFGFLALDMLSIIAADSGEYVCRVTSATGVAESRAILTIHQRSSIEQTSQHPSSLQQIQHLEDYSRYQRQESIDESINQKPVFIRPLQNLGELEEGRNAHFEAQLTPVSDPTMRVEWYKDGRPITASSRITAIFNFGYVSLNIMHLRAEDSGSYAVRAVNRLGEAISTSTVNIFSRSTVTADLGIPEQQRYIEKVEELEAYQKHQHQKYVHEVQESATPPEFKTPIKDQLNIKEGGYAHFEARLEPIGDSSLRVEWFKDGRPVEASSRTTSFHNFGYVALTVKQLTVHDVGTYTCRAENTLGQAATSAKLTVVTKQDIIFDSQHPNGLDKIQHLEDSSRYSRRQEEEVQVTKVPKFLGPLKGTNKILEGQRAHFEARVEPQSDLTMSVEWYHNGKPIMPANRTQVYHDFGYVALDIVSVREDDAGVYTVVARNAMGEAQAQSTMVVETRTSIDTTSMHRGMFERTQTLENSKFVEPQYDVEEISKSKPIFVQPLSDPKPVGEGKNIHLECRLEPLGDPTMRVEWFHNGRPITIGSRFRTYYDFGFVALDIVHATSLDTGEYTVAAQNHLGSAHISACVRVIGRSDIVTDSQNETSMEHIQMLEDSSRRRNQVAEDITVMQAPQFTRPLHNIETVEGTNVHLECRLQPVGDPSMRVEWLVNGYPVRTGHRFRPAYEFDYVALDLLGVYAIDAGVYTCQARNQLGEAVTSGSVRVIAKKDLILETQHPGGLEKIQSLEDSSRYRRSEVSDEIINIKPRFLTKPKDLLNMREGKHAHFECKLEPVTDTNLKVEWFKNGRPVTIGHRFRPIHDFGYVALDIIDLIAEDSGVYSCRAVNLVGTDETNCTLQCRGSEQILTTTQNESGLEQIQFLEDRSKYSRSEVIDEVTKQAPVFTTSLKNVEIKEGQRAHFECRLIPVSDPTMKVEWYHNNAPLKSGSRFSETNNFGFVALDIMGCLPDDAGSYTCRAVNALGEAVTSAVAVIHTQKSIYMESQHEGALHSLHRLEDTSRYQRHSAQDEVITQAPVFTLPVRDIRVAENQAVHFEARLIPVGDPKLKVQWLRNGVPLAASNRTTTMHDFGYVALNMKYVNPEDSGTYTCKAENELGQAVTSASLIVQSKAALQMETQNETALQKIHQLEDTSRYQRREDDESIVTQAPRFTTQLNGPTNLCEGQSAHYECRIEPYPDPNLKVEWFHNGQPLQTGHRFRTTCDFGFAALDVLTVYGEDSGEYTCVATNQLGQAQSSIRLNVQPRAGIIRETQHEGALEKIHYLENDSRYRRKTDDEQFVAEKPQFGRPLKNAVVQEGKPVHLEATLTPVNDPTMRVEWYCNGRPIPQGHRFKTTYDFGFVALDILYAHAEDTGTYSCRAKNAVGEAVTTCSVSATANSGLYLDTLDEQRLRKIRELENYQKPITPEVEEQGQKPVFLTPLANLENLKEGDHAHLECRVEPINDPNLKIEWYINGKAIRAGHRFRTTHDFGYVALDVLYVYGEDTGTYICRATNALGEAMNTCDVRIMNRRSIILDTQHPDGLEKIQKLESKGQTYRSEIAELPISPPRFVTELRGPSEIHEGQTAHFEAQVEPIHDPNLRIEFYHNGKPLPSASRFHITFDFGYVALDLTHAVAADAGEYTVRAVNALGQCKSSTTMKVITRGGIITEPQRPEGLEQILKLESHQPFQRPQIEDPITRQRPVFTQPLQNIDSIPEGQTAHFECRLIPVGDPNLKVEWFRNEKPIEDSSRITTQHDFGFVSMDISHIRDDDQGVYMCRATNPLGEAVTTASMRVRTKASIQLDSQHPESVRRLQQLEQLPETRPDAPERVFEKPIFTQLLTGPAELWEGQHAHFEARVVPVGDPNLRFEWYVNGVELKMGSRFRTTHDFGFVSLDINSTVATDSGVYMCRAVNLAGEAVSSSAMKIKTRSSIAGESLLPESWQKIQMKEAAMNRVPEMFIDQSPQQAPVFTTHLQSYDQLNEGQHIQLEAQVEPRADPNLKIEWFKNGMSLTTGARIRSTFDFGLVTLSINGLRMDDSAIYTCVARNSKGEAVSTATLKIGGYPSIMGDSLHPSALPQIAALEAPRQDRRETAEPVFESPVFITHLNNVECKENDNVHFECNVEPSKDPTMQIEWFVNGKQLPAGSRYKTTYDFGYVALDVMGAYAEDSGIYTCKATNSKGSATTSGSLRCIGSKSMYLDTQHPQGIAGLEAVEETEAAIANRYQRQASRPEKEYPKPIWTVPLQPEFHLSEAQPLHLEAQVEPKEDPNLKIEWYFNGKVLEHGSRFKMTSEFGFVTLDLTEVYERDQGIYTCKASNLSGEAFTSTTVFCSSKESIIEQTQHPMGTQGLETIQNLEESLRRGEGQAVGPEEGHAPRFTSEFTSLSNIGEGEIAHFEASLIPTGDQSMVVEWFYNGKTLDASHRFRTVYAFGMVVLEVLGTKIEDSGTYVCRATNKWGQAEISVTLGCVDKSGGQPPKFTSQIQSLGGLKDGQSAHFECTLVPVGDPDMKVEWFMNGKPIRHSTRIKPVSDFGYVLLDIAYVQSHDSGEYVCRASNKYGEDFTKATIECFGKSGVFYDSLQPESLARIRELENAYAGQQSAVPSTPIGEAPKFTTQIVEISKLVEGQSAHFEARLTPMTDPDLVVEWYYNGRKLPHGHRYRTFHDFGIVILDILYCYEENSGVYECRATNKYGSDVTKATLRCLSKANLILDSQLPRGMEGGLEKIQTLEDSLVRTKDDRVTELGGRAPVFTAPLSNVDSLREGENVHFEARVIPTDDPRLKVEWFWNGKPLKAGSRFRTFCDFGFVILEISPVYPEDSGDYTCYAINDYGEAVTTATMKVQGKRSIILESQLPAGMEGTIERIAELEGYGMAPQIAPEEDSGKPPEFVTTPADLTIGENQLAHFECRLTPINDPSMRVEWYHNGKALWSGSRIKTINDFGFVILEIAGCYQRDSGLYSCKATNKHGEATVSCKLSVKGRQGIIMEPQLPSNFRTGTESLQRLEESLHKQEEIFSDEEKPNPPHFTVEIADNLDIPEGGPVHFDCRVEPIGDPTMRIDWFFNGRPLNTGSRIHMLNDFGFIALDMDYAYARDSGEYLCRATNRWGTATTVANVSCIGRHGIISESQLPDGMTAERLKDLERGPVSVAPKEDEQMGPPRFLSQIESATVEEAESIRFECRVEPKDDPRLRIEWYRNGKLLPSGHRYRNVYDLGFVSLDILYVYGEDSGEYVCRAVNDYGEAFTKASISCKQLPSIILQNQVPKGMKRSETLMQMEAAVKKYTSEVFLTEDDLYDSEKRQPPRFVTQILDQTNLIERQTTKFECQLAPVGDPNMKVEWFFNGKPLHHKNRLTPIYDFGYVAMNFSWVYPEDSGEYVCRATNLYGMDETRAVIKTAGTPGIIYESQLPKHMKSIEKIREMEASWQVVPEAPDEDAKPKCAPVFVSKPEPVTVEEGEWARFCARVTGHPRPRVMWLVNGHTVVNGSRYKLTYDGMYHLDIPKTRQYDTGKIEVIARSSVGEALATTDLTVVQRKDDYRGVLKNSPRPWYDYDLVQYQKEREDTELEKTFEERKQYLAEQSQGGREIVAEHLKQKMPQKVEPAWTQAVKDKKTGDYYNKLQELETDQLLRETKLREESHQFAIPGEKVVNSSMAKGMASKYEQNLEREDIVDQRTNTVVKRVQKVAPPEPLESSVHGREVHVNKQKQVQKQTVGDLEITRKITATETTEVEHKGTTQERVVEGPVKPAKAPFFTKKIQPCRVFENEQARFEVEFDGDPIPTVKWFRENFLIQNSSDFQIHTFGTKSVLIIRQVFSEDSAVFAAIAENRGGTAKCSANLVVEERKQQGKGGAVPPSFLTTIQDANVTEGQLARFDVRVNGTKPMDVYWLKNGRKITPNIKYKTVEEDNNYTLLIIEAYQDDTGKYECVAVNNAGEARCDAECFVRSSVTPAKKEVIAPGSEKTPTVIEPLRDQTIAEGASVIFKCRVIGKPNPAAQWYKGNNIIKQSKFFKMNRDGEYYSLRISEAFPEDEGTYKCELSNSVGQVSTSAKLKVLAPEPQETLPTLTPLKDLIVEEGNPAQFQTTISGKTKATNVQWFRDGALIPESPDFQMIYDGNNAVLLIGTTYEEDTGIFTCRVTSTAGQVKTSAKLTVKSKK